MKNYIGLEEMGNQNCAVVLDLIRQHGELSRKEIAERTKLSWGGMTKIVNKLFESGYIVEDKSEQQTGQGRIPNIIKINRTRNFVIGLDINRMGFRACVMNLAGEVLQEYVADGAYDNKQDLLRAILSFTGKIVEECRACHILAIGIAMQGVLDAQRGVSVRFPRCADWENIPLKEILEDRFSVPVFMEHDPDCILYSVLQTEKQENVLLMRIDSSVGMAVSIGGKILKGNGVLEVAHQIIVPGGKPCRCGQLGCLEAYIAPCLVNKEIQPAAVAEMILQLATCMKNMCGLFNAKNMVLTGDLVQHRRLFEKALLDAFSPTVPVTFINESNHAVLGATQMAVARAIADIKIG